MSTITVAKKGKLAKSKISKGIENFDNDLFATIAKKMGPSIYLTEDSKDLLSEKELKKIKLNFLIKKLGLSNSKELDNEYNAITQEFINSKFSKTRAIFYYFLVVNFNKEHIFLDSNENSLVNFGEDFIKNQKDLDHDIFEFINKNFSSLF